MDTTIVEAYIGLASIHQIWGNQKEYFTYLEKGFYVNQNHPNLLLLLAEHYLYSGNYDFAKKLAIKGLIEYRKFSQILFFEMNKN